MDGQLFAIKNLMQLRDHATFYKTQEARHTKQFSLLDIFGVLKNVLRDNNSEKDHIPIRLVLDRDLKNACESFIKLVVDSCVPNFLKQKESMQNIRVGTPIFIAPEEFINIFSAEVEGLKPKLEIAITKLRQYLGDRQAQMTLLRIIRGTILKEVKIYLDLIAQHGAKDCGTEAEAAAKLDEAFKALL